MSLYTQNTEDALLKKLDVIKTSPEGWGVISLNQRHFTPHQKRVLREKDAHTYFLRLMEEEKIIPYFCRDGDVLFVFQGMRQNSMEKVEVLLRSVLPEYGEENVEVMSLLDVFLLSEDFEKVFNLVSAKQLALLNEQEQQAARLMKEMGMEASGWSAEKFETALKERQERTHKLALVVEDDESLREIARTTLMGLFSVLVAEDGKAALSIYNRHAPDLVFLDINMPGQSGVELLGILMEKDPTAQVIMFSRENTPDIVKKTLTMGAKGYVLKPFTQKSLLTYARKFI